LFHNFQISYFSYKVEKIIMTVVPYLCRYLMIERERERERERDNWCCEMLLPHVA